MSQLGWQGGRRGILSGIVTLPRPFLVKAGRILRYLGFLWGAEEEKMEYLIGLMLSLAVAAFGAATGFARARAFYPTVAIVVASYYVLFAAMGASRQALIEEIAVATAFLVAAVLGFRGNFWWIVAALVGHGMFDFVHRIFIDNPGVPRWWPGFCLAFDALLGALLAVSLVRHPERVPFGEK